jgi:hypothetical protein
MARTHETCPVCDQAMRVTADGVRLIVYNERAGLVHARCAVRVMGYRRDY